MACYPCNLCNKCGRYDHIVALGSTCPKCGQHYERGVTKCPGCGFPLPALPGIADTEEE